jgi:ATP-dependent DNA helicase
MLAHLTEQGVQGPFMVVGPLSTLHNWANEFKKWTPELEAVIYHGSKETRASLRGTYYRGKRNFPVMITSYEIVIRDIKELKKIPWKFVIIDEGHRLKNMNCRLIRELKTICGDGCNRLLLTGTPLQNNLTELWSLLNFLLPSIFDDLDSFQAWFDFDFSREDNEQKVFEGEMQHSVVTKLHQILRPFLLRRLKADVELGLPKKHEYILFAWLSEWQSAMYEDLLKKQLADSAGKTMRMQNVLMQLRKCCNHPYLFEWPVDGSGRETVDEILVEASGKMQLLDRILSELKKEGGHQVLIFSQMTRMLDILEDYLTWRGASFRRLDGTVAAEDRMQSMKEFNEQNIDVFLLSTRAGGLGINLVSADTVIIFDSDW